MRNGKNLFVEKVDASEAAFSEVFPLLLELHKTVGVFRLNPSKMAEQCYGVLARGMSFVVRDETCAIGSIGLVEATAWYSDDEYLQDKWLYVRPSHRGLAGLALLRAARDEGIARDRIVYVWNTNPDKRQKGLPFGVERAAAGVCAVRVHAEAQRLKKGQADVLRERDQIDDDGSRLHRGGGKVAG